MLLPRVEEGCAPPSLDRVQELLLCGCRVPLVSAAEEPNETMRPSCVALVTRFSLCPPEEEETWCVPTGCQADPSLRQV